MMRYILAIPPTLVVPLLFWIAGFNFDERGPVALFCTMVTAIAYWVAIHYDYDCKKGGGICDSARK